MFGNTITSEANNSDEAAEILENEANLWAEKGYYERALRNYDKIAEIQPSDSKGLHLKADLLRDIELYDDALDCYDEALKINADDPELLVCKGIALTRNGHFRDSTDCFDKAIELTPFEDYPYAWYQKGLSLDAAGDRQTAENNFGKALELINYRLQDAIGQKIEMLFQLKRDDQTIDACNELLKLDPKNGWCWYIKGESQFRLGKFDDAVKSYSKAVETFDQDSTSFSKYIETVYCRARAYASTNDVVNALADLEVVMDFNVEQGLERIEKDEVFNSLKNNQDFKTMVSECSEKNRKL